MIKPRNATQDRPLFLRPRSIRTELSPVWYWLYESDMKNVRPIYRILRRSGLTAREARQRIVLVIGAQPAA